MKVVDVGTETAVMFSNRRYIKSPERCQGA